MDMTQEEIIAERDEFDKMLRQLEDEVAILKERIDIAREKINKVNTFEDAKAFDNWYEKNHIGDGLQFIEVEGM